MINESDRPYLGPTDSSHTAAPSTYNRNTITSQSDSSGARVEVMVVCRFRFPASQSMQNIQQWLDENVPLGEEDSFTITGVDIIKD